MSNNRIKKFRESWDEDEWGSNDSRSKGKEKTKGNISFLTVGMTKT